VTVGLARHIPVHREARAGPAHPHPACPRGPTLKASDGPPIVGEMPRRVALMLAFLGAAIGCGEAERAAPEPPPASARPASARPAPAQPAAELPPLPDAMRPRAVEPRAGEPGVAAVGGAVKAAPAPERAAPAPRRPGPKASALPTGGTAKAADALARATALPNGIALPPLDAPEEVERIIQAGNMIARAPYKWGGGHGRWQDDGYDCSGSVSYALHFAGLLDGPRTSGGLTSYGEPGRGKWVTVWATDGHVFMEVAGIRFDTSGARVTGSRWQRALRGDHARFIPRHPPGL